MEPLFPSSQSIHRSKRTHDQSSRLLFATQVRSKLSGVAKSKGIYNQVDHVRVYLFRKDPAWTIHSVQNSVELAGGI